MFALVDVGVSLNISTYTYVFTRTQSPSGRPFSRPSLISLVAYTGAATCALGAFKRLAPRLRGLHVVVIACGGNIALPTLQRYGAAPAVQPRFGVAVPGTSRKRTNKGRVIALC